MADRLSTPVQRAQEPTTFRPMRSDSLLDRVHEVFYYITRRALEIFDGNCHVFGRELDDWLKAEREFLHPIHIQLAESED